MRCEKSAKGKKTQGVVESGMSRLWGWISSGCWCASLAVVWWCVHALPWLCVKMLKTKNRKVKVKEVLASLSSTVVARSVTTVDCINYDVTVENLEACPARYATRYRTRDFFLYFWWCTHRVKLERYLATDRQGIPTRLEEEKVFFLLLRSQVHWWHNESNGWTNQRYYAQANSRGDILHFFFFFVSVSHFFHTFLFAFRLFFFFLLLHLFHSHFPTFLLLSHPNSTFPLIHYYLYLLCTTSTYLSNSDTHSRQLLVDLIHYELSRFR